jgi:hypothetical protein
MKNRKVIIIVALLILAAIIAYFLLSDKDSISKKPYTTDFTESYSFKIEDGNIVLAFENTNTMKKGMFLQGKWWGNS